MSMKKVYWLVLLLYASLNAQTPHIQKDFQKILLRKNPSNFIPKFLSKYQSLGYAEITIDTTTNPYRLHTGRIYFLRSYSNNQNYPLKNSNLKIGEPFSWKNWNDFHKKVLTYYGNLGFPMVNILPTLQYTPQGDTLYIDIHEQIDLQKSYTIDSIILPKGIKENPKFIYKLIDLGPGDKFHQEKIEKITKNLKCSEYYHQIQSPKLQFSDSTTKITLDFQKLRNNRFDLLIGLLPPQNAIQKLQFTVMADFALISMFRQGEILRMKYDKLQNLSQKLHLEYIHPFVLQLPVKFHLQFSLFKQDTSFLNREVKIGGSYLINPESEILFSYQRKTSNLISVSRYQNVNWPPPPQLDSRSNTYAFGYQWKQLDNPWNPAKGTYLMFLGNAGVRNILKVRGLENLDYERIGKIQPKQEVEIKVFQYTTIGKRTVAVLGVQGYYLNQKNYFDNDLRPIGGYKLLRGFNENTFWAAYYGLLTIEYRLILEELSYLGIFTDLAYIHQIKFQQNQIYKPIGTGIALNFSTNLGIMSVSYAIGKYENLNFQPTRGRIHVGIINNF